MVMLGEYSCLSSLGHSQSFGCGYARSPFVVLPFVFVLRQDGDKEITLLHYIEIFNVA